MSAQLGSRRGRMKKLLAAGALGCAFASVALPAPAAACSPSDCSPGSFFLAPDAQVPANAPALRWRPPSSYDVKSSEASLRITRDGGEPVAFELEPGPGTSEVKLIRFPEGLQVGSRYRLNADLPPSSDGCAAKDAEFEVVAGAELPAQLGRVLLGEPRRDVVEVWTVSGSCFAPVPVVASAVDLELAPEAQPWAGLFLYAHDVDGKGWGPSWTLDDPDYTLLPLTGAQTRVYSECAGPLPDGRPIDPGVSHYGVDEGVHSVTIEARLPGVERVLRSDSVEVELECGDAPAAEPKPNPIGGDEPGDDAADPTDAAAGSGAPPDHDEAGDDEPRGERTYVETKPAEHDSNCATVDAGSARGGSAFALALALPLLLLALRWRR